MPRRSKDYAICPCCNKVTDLTGEAAERDPNLVGECNLCDCKFDLYAASFVDEEDLPIPQATLDDWATQRRKRQAERVREYKRKKS